MKEKVDKILEYTLIAIMTILVIDVLWQVFTRYVLPSPSSFTDELAGFLLMWIGILGAAYVTGKKEHLAIDIFIQKSGPKQQAKLLFLVDAFIALFAIVVMIVGGLWLVLTRFQLNVNSAALHLPLGYVYAVIPISGVLIIYYSLYYMFLRMKNQA